MTFYSKNYYAVIYLATALIILTLLSFYVPSFPDYQGYNRYVTELSALERFAREPLSAWMMWIIGVLGGGGVAYYTLATAVYLFSVMYLCLKNKSEDYLFYLFLCFNPIVLIIFHVPRFTMAVGFILIAFGARGRVVALLSIAAILTHTVMGVYGVVLLAAYYVRPRYYLPGIALGAGVFLIILFGVVDTHYSSYLVGEHDRGRFRLLIYLILFVLAVFSLKRLLTTRVNILAFMLFGAFMYIMTPFAHRFLVPNFLLLLITLHFANLERLNRELFYAYQIVMLLPSLAVLYFEMFDYKLAL
ncbi:hypothetical protein [Thalassolituus oleivorans]|uniref:hypothetical protein n=1 Tax=Thalassolituus oleivorans TaxID=187493 RepID=UPI0023F4514A|nr:hypothetical protein [Thalassolituus oleivorans]